VVGAALPPGGPLHAFIWNGRRLRDIGTLGGDNEATVARDINDAGQITGYSPNADGRVDAFLWERGVMHDLGVPDGATSSSGYGINNRGQVVGTAGFGEFLDPDAHARAVICPSRRRHDHTQRPFVPGRPSDWERQALRVPSPTDFLATPVCAHAKSTKPDVIQDEDSLHEGGRPVRAAGQA